MPLDSDFLKSWSHLDNYEKGTDFVDGEEKLNTHHDTENEDVSIEKLNKNFLMLSDIKKMSEKDKISKDLFVDFIKSLFKSTYLCDYCKIYEISLIIMLLQKNEVIVIYR